MAKLKRSGPMGVVQNSEAPTAARTFIPSSTGSVPVPPMVLSSPQIDPASANNPPEMPYSSGTPMGNCASVRRAQK